jgi:branched-subunit amino acid aminotransferase/4-amino-4-deoxychorismate lyase
LPGVTRGAMLDFAACESIEICAEMLSMDDVLDADEVFMTNSSWGVLPVVSVEAAAIGDGMPGPVTKRLRQMLLDDKSPR